MRDARRRRGEALPQRSQQDIRAPRVEGASGRASRLSNDGCASDLLSIHQVGEALPMKFSKPRPHPWPQRDLKTGQATTRRSTMHHQANGVGGQHIAVGAPWETSLQ
eukprot:scaffold131556_cov34-Tisochrysis_lutea.AAC.2